MSRSMCLSRFTLSPSTLKWAWPWVRWPTAPRGHHLLPLPAPDSEHLQKTKRPGWEINNCSIFTFESSLELFLKLYWFLFQSLVLWMTSQTSPPLSESVLGSLRTTCSPPALTDEVNHRRCFLKWYTFGCCSDFKSVKCSAVWFSHIKLSSLTLISSRVHNSFLFFSFCSYLRSHRNTRDEGEPSEAASGNHVCDKADQRSQRLHEIDKSWLRGAGLAQHPRQPGTNGPTQPQSRGITVLKTVARVTFW